MTPKQIGILGFDGVVGSHLTGPTDAFAMATLDDGFGNHIACYEVWTIGVRPGPFRSESGMVFHPQRTLRTAPPLDTIILPGGSGLRRSEVSGKISNWILRRAAQTERIASICTGIYGLASTGLLDGRDVTTHWRFASDIRRRFPSLRVDHKRLLVKDGPFYTSTGITAGIDLSLALIEEDYGRYVALAAAQEMVTPLTRRGIEEERQPALSPTYANHSDSSPSCGRFADLVAWMVRNLQADLSVDALARQACMCPGHFSRAFKSVFGTPPSEFVENLRLNEAKRRLATRRKTLQSVATSLGFQSADSFYRAFERRFGIRPSRFGDALGERTAHSRPRFVKVDT
jgi:transcriptional regulator GlxA family with amidase domain